MYQQQYGECLSQLLQFKGLAKKLHPGLEQFKKQIQENMQMSWQGYMETECTCYDAPETARLGASWVSHNADDIANHEDLEEFASHFWPSRD